ncbi:MAG: hypothetical protein AB9866_11270 [Syntrophobacteraceae bacterium]
MQTIVLQPHKHPSSQTLKNSYSPEEDVALGIMEFAAAKAGE